ncbi:unnamed protein product [Boreogadus saida]
MKTIAGLQDLPPFSSRSQLKGEAERLGTGGLWCQGGPEAGDQGPAAPDQRVTSDAGGGVSCIPRACLVEELVEALPDEGRLSWDQDSV